MASHPTSHTFEASSQWPGLSWRLGADPNPRTTHGSLGRRTRHLHAGSAASRLGPAPGPKPPPATLPTAPGRFPQPFAVAILCLRLWPKAECIPPGATLPNLSMAPFSLCYFERARRREKTSNAIKINSLCSPGALATGKGLTLRPGSERDAKWGRGRDARGRQGQPSHFCKVSLQQQEQDAPTPSPPALTTR